MVKKGIKDKCIMYYPIIFTIKEKNKSRTVKLKLISDAYCTAFTSNLKL